MKEMGKARKLLVQELKPRPLEYETEILTTLFRWLVSLHLKITVMNSPCQMFIYVCIDIFYEGLYIHYIRSYVNIIFDKIIGIILKGSDDGV
jgi:uncharacterized membrane protein (DUF106 family)